LDDSPKICFPGSSLSVRPWIEILRANSALRITTLIGSLLRLFVRRVLPACTAELLRFHAVRMLLLVFCRGVIPVLALTTLQRNDFAHFPDSFLRARTGFRRPTSNYSTISTTAPAPTVCPPSRIAKRNPFSRATGVISVTSQLTLSPGMTISTPVGNFTSPVTSVVRK
jgi:hypothetical protein